MSTTSNIVVAGIVGLAIGFGGGYMIGEGGDGGKTEDGMTRDGGEGLTPCQAAGAVPEGQWSKVTCGTQQACAILDQIQTLAVADATAGRIGPGMLAQINDLLLKCATNTAAVQLGGAEHCQKLNAAKNAAVQHNWPLCIQQMEHGH